MRRSAALVLLVLGSFCDSTNPTGGDPPTALAQGDVLDSAYATNDTALLDTFLSRWAGELSSLTPAEQEALSDTVAAAYAAFRAFYHPEQLSLVTGGTHEFGQDSLSFAVVQTSLTVGVSDTVSSERLYMSPATSWDTVSDFRPAVDIGSVEPLFLSPAYEALLTSFLLDSAGQYYTDSQERAAFLTQRINIFHHHWVPGWHLLTAPSVSGMLLDTTLTRAMLSFRVFYQFGEAVLEKGPAGWRIVRSELTGVE